MVNTEFWYAEVGSRAEGKSRNGGQSMRWWLPSPRVPTVGLSEIERKRLLHQGKLIYQVFKAAKAINNQVLVEMPIPPAIKDSLPKVTYPSILDNIDGTNFFVIFSFFFFQSGKASLGEEMYRVLTAELGTVEEMMNCLNLKSEHGALEAINRLEAAIFVWKDKITDHGNRKSPARTSWSFVKDPIYELDKTETLMRRAELLLLQINNKYPNLPQTFLDVTKVQYCKVSYKYLNI